MNFESFIALRYVRARRSNGFISFISLVSVIGIALGVAALIVVLSVMNGFQKEIRSRILGVASHVEIQGSSGALAYWPQVADAARTVPHVIGAAPFVNAQGLLSMAGNVRGAMIRGIEPALENQVVDVGQHMLRGQLTDLRGGEFGVVIGVELARALGVGVGDKVTLITPQGQVTPAGMLPRLKQFTVRGIFKVDMYEYDASLAMIHLQDAQLLFRLGQDVSGVRLKLTDSLDAPQVKKALLGMLNEQAFVTDWTEQNANYFRAVQIEKRMMFIILTLIVAVAAFNLVSTLVMVVTDKRADIAILRTLGLSPNGVMKVFIVQGMVAGFFGTLFGVIVGVLLGSYIGTVLAFFEKTFGFQLINSQIYFIDYLPSDVNLPDVLTVAGFSLFLALLATLYPSWRAARTRPADALRYE